MMIVTIQSPKDLIKVGDLVWQLNFFGLPKLYIVLLLFFPLKLYETKIIH